MSTSNKRERSTSGDPPTAANDWTDALRTSELRYRRLFETAQDGILILDANSGEIMDVNPFLIDLLNYPFEELRGRKLWEIGEFKDVAASQSAFEKLQQNEYIPASARPQISPGPRKRNDRSIDNSLRQKPAGGVERSKN